MKVMADAHCHFQWIEIQHGGSRNHEYSL